MGHFMLSAMLALSLFCGMILFLEVGRRLGARRKIQEDDGGAIGIGALEGSIFALLGLMIAFTFSGALSRFDSRRELIVEETNDIGTAYLRLALLPPETQPALKNLFRQYMDGRLEVYRKLPDLEAARREMTRVQNLQGIIWTQALAAAQKSTTPAASILLMPALNTMFDILTTQDMAARLHPPTIVFAMLFMMGLISALLAGYDMARGQDRHWMHVISFAAVVALSFYVVLDLEYPRLGFIRIDDFDQAMVNLQASMK